MTEYFNLISLIVIFIILIEVIFYVLVTFVRKHFQWMITSKDENPHFSEEGLDKFVPHGYDSELGWVRKPNTSGVDQNTFISSKWTINSLGSRTNPDFDNKKSHISCYGDSFTFCRQVNNDQTWEHYLSKSTNSNVLNFGVGNYGIDQSLLRLKREYEKNPTKIVIIGVVPDTISRIMSYWKHYYEYGNTFAFKPKFKIENNVLKLLPNKVNDPKKFHSINKILNEIKNEDYFYKLKFLKEIIKFPYILHVLKNSKRNFKIIFWVLLLQFKKRNSADISSIEWNPMKPIMEINLKWRISLYKNKNSLQLFTEILKEFVNFSKIHNFTPIFLLIPQKDDLIYIKNNYNFMNLFFKQISKISDLHVIDITSDFLNESNFDNLYSDDNEYGGHPNTKGNQLISKIVQNYLISKNFLDN
ncbi:hypothetical protein [Nitrosopumilus sp.]|uniref:hypothetical protein n=1 Tax=Nitrosopumilus sp. TaxID=2024843 RepID=UPI0026121A32|nr:hypothetical protein [Nitrosopumilus sp.]